MYSLSDALLFDQDTQWPNQFDIKYCLDGYNRSQRKKFTRSPIYWLGTRILEKMQSQLVGEAKILVEKTHEMCEAKVHDFFSQRKQTYRFSDDRDLILDESSWFWAFMTFTRKNTIKALFPNASDTVIADLSMFAHSLIEEHCALFILCLLSSNNLMNEFLQVISEITIYGLEVEFMEFEDALEIMNTGAYHRVNEATLSRESPFHKVKITTSSWRFPENVSIFLQHLQFRSSVETTLSPETPFFKKASVFLSKYFRAIRFVKYSISQPNTTPFMFRCGASSDLLHAYSVMDPLPQTTYLPNPKTAMAMMFDIDGDFEDLSKPFIFLHKEEIPFKQCVLSDPDMDYPRADVLDLWDEKAEKFRKIIGMHSNLNLSHDTYVFITGMMELDAVFNSFKYHVIRNRPDTFLDSVEKVLTDKKSLEGIDWTTLKLLKLKTGDPIKEIAQLSGKTDEVHGSFSIALISTMQKEEYVQYPMMSYDFWKSYRSAILDCFNCRFQTPFLEDRRLQVVDMVTKAIVQLMAISHNKLFV